MCVCRHYSRTISLSRILNQSKYQTVFFQSNHFYSTRMFVGNNVRSLQAVHSDRIITLEIVVTLWWTNILPWKITMFHGKIHYKWPFSIAFCMFTRPGISEFKVVLGCPWCMENPAVALESESMYQNIGAWSAWIFHGNYADNKTMLLECMDSMFLGMDHGFHVYPAAAPDRPSWPSPCFAGVTWHPAADAKNRIGHDQRPTVK